MALFGAYVALRTLPLTNAQHGIPCFLKRGPLPDWPVWTREQMISGGAAEREDREDEAESDKPDRMQHFGQNKENFVYPVYLFRAVFISPQTQLKIFW